MANLTGIQNERGAEAQVLLSFTSHERKYFFDEHGAIHQADARPYIYDDKYCSTYDTEQYRRHNDILQALRYGFVCAALGRIPHSLLDYGYGNGAFLKFARQESRTNLYGFDLTGIQVDGAKIIDAPVPAQVYTFWDALEHIPDLSFVAELKCERICLSLPHCHFLYDDERTNGYFSKHQKDLFDDWHHRKPDEHLHHFNVESLRSFMHSFGWSMIAHSKHEDIIRKGYGHPQIQGWNILSAAFKRF